jgi:2-succinyl-5-enolpyruvyl-6-hydroxy-3-cyclohexene-1-carboxylate synthase
MEAYYAGIPLILITTDRPRRFRGSGGPQCAEQKGLFGIYAIFEKDCAQSEYFNLAEWPCGGPAHLNICFEEPDRQWPDTPFPLTINKPCLSQKIPLSLETSNYSSHRKCLDAFLESIHTPLVVVSTLKPCAKESVIQFLVNLNAPVFLESVSRLREDPRLNHLKITKTEKLWESSEQAQYPIDSILRIGGVPTFRLWRDLEDKSSSIKVCSLSDRPFAGLSWADVIAVDIKGFLDGYRFKPFDLSSSKKWLDADKMYSQQLHQLFYEEPKAEPSLLFHLSQIIPQKARIYLGNSLPIREWDLAADREDKHFEVFASRGLNGIDGQISTFLGLCHPDYSNWAILGDLTTLYDMAGPWILSQLPNVKAQIVIMNNGGGKIFSRMFSDQAMQNQHDLNFEALANMWKLPYKKMIEIPLNFGCLDRSHIIEIVPDNDSTERFWKKMSQF